MSGRFAILQGYLGEQFQQKYDSIKKIRRDAKSEIKNTHENTIIMHEKRVIMICYTE